MFSSSCRSGLILDRRVSTIYRPGCSVDEGGLVRGQEGDDVGDLHRLSEAAAGMAIDEVLVQVVVRRDALGQRRVDEARADCVDSDAARAEPIPPASSPGSSPRAS